MKKIVEFMKECDAFFVITKNGSFPSSRPFGAIMEDDSKLYICTNSKKKVFKQIIKDNHLHICGIKRSTRTWIRFNALAYLIENQKLKETFFKKYPRLNLIYKTPNNNCFKVFKIKVSKLEIHKD